MVKLRITCQAHQPLFRPIIGFYIKDRHGQNLFGDNTYLVYMDQPLSIDAGKTFVGESFFGCPFFPAETTASVRPLRKEPNRNMCSITGFTMR